MVIKMSTGEIRTVTVPDSRTAIVDGHEITVHDLKPGTSLTATRHHHDSCYRADDVKPKGDSVVCAGQYCDSDPA